MLRHASRMSGMDTHVTPPKNAKELSSKSKAAIRGRPLHVQVASPAGTDHDRTVPG